MPYQPKKPCKATGCPELTYNTYCDYHKKMFRQKDNRPSAYKRGYTQRWYKEKAKFLKMYPYCVSCGDVAKVVDHIKPHKGDMKLFWDVSNWQGMCKSCHDRKTAKHDGGFGNK